MRWLVDKKHIKLTFCYERGKNKMFRVINEDLSFNGELDIIAECSTIEEAEQHEVDNYYFNTTVEQLIDGNWELVLVNGMTEEEIKQFI